jgi:hypothetical protein
LYYSKTLNLLTTIGYGLFGAQYSYFILFNHDYNKN